MNKWYMLNPAAVLENGTYKLLWNFDIQTSPDLGQKTRRYSNQQRKENVQNCQLCWTGWPQNITESEKKDKYLDLAKQLKKTMEREGDDYTNRDWCIRYNK